MLFPIPTINKIREQGSLLLLMLQCVGISPTFSQSHHKRYGQNQNTFMNSKAYEFCIFSYLQYSTVFNILNSKPSTVLKIRYISIHLYLIYTLLCKFSTLSGVTMYIDERVCGLLRACTGVFCCCAALTVDAAWFGWGEARLVG